jgi:hypothetical protein
MSTTLKIKYGSLRFEVPSMEVSKDGSLSRTKGFDGEHVIVPVPQKKAIRKPRKRAC